MKKIFRNPLFVFILSTIFYGSIGVYAVQLLAKDVSYTPQDNSWNVSDVKMALDDLYTTTNTTISNLNNEISELNKYDKCVYGEGIINNSATTSNGQLIENTVTPSFFVLIGKNLDWVQYYKQGFNNNKC